MPLKQNPAVTIEAFGSVEALQFHADHPYPTCQDGEVLIENHCAGINPIDCKTRAGLGWAAQRIAEHLPAILGFDKAGIVVASRDPRFAVGDRVCALDFNGNAYTRYTCINADLIAPIPAQLSFAQAGALPCAGTTAYQLIKQAAIQPGQHVVISAPAGGVGHLALQLLAGKGATITVITSEEKYHLIRELAPISSWINYREVKTFPSLNADLLLDLVGGEAGVQALNTLGEGARAICLPSIHVPMLQAAGEERGLHVEGFIVNPNAEDLASVLNLVSTESLKLHIMQQYALHDIAKAHTAQESGRAFGKLLLNIESEA